MIYANGYAPRSSHFMSKLITSIEIEFKGLSLTCPMKASTASLNAHAFIKILNVFIGYAVDGILVIHMWHMRSRKGVRGVSIVHRGD